MHTALFVIYVVLLVYVWLIVARALLSWFPTRPGSPMLPVKRVLHVLTEPYLAIFRRLLPVARVGSVGFDLSTVVGVVVLVILIQVVTRI